MMRMRRSVLGCLLALSGVAGAEGFDAETPGPLARLQGEYGVWSAPAGHAELHAGHGRTGNRCLRLLGGADHVMELALEEPLSADAELAFWAERWTRRAPFAFRVAARNGNGGRWTEVYNGDRILKIGGFLTEVVVPLGAGVDAMRFSATTPEGSGVMIDDVTLGKAEPMRVPSVEVVQPVIPVLTRVRDNPVAALKVTTRGRAAPRQLRTLRVSLDGTSHMDDVKAVRVIHIGAGYDLAGGTQFGDAQEAAPELVFSGRRALMVGENHFWVSVELEDGADIDGRVDAGILGVQVDGETLAPPSPASPDGAQRIGVGVAVAGDGNSQTFRIPGLATTNKGTLIGVYDVRYKHGHDLPGDIDVGMSRSTDGGRTWEPLKVIMDMGNDKKWLYDGIGDPAVLVDRSNNRIWVVATWSHGNRSWRGSGQGMSPEETGQLVMVFSDDDGQSWSEPVNVTRQVKRPEWHFLLQGPGKGITMTDGTLVFPAQFQDGDKNPDGSKKGTPFSTLIYSGDHGRTWHVGTGIKSNTTEAQLVELADGSIMLNCRDNRGGTRTIGVTRDLGQTWELHPTDRKALNEPVCMASLIRIEHRKHGNLLFFSNPDTTRGRSHMTIKVSKDEGMTWPEEMHTLYDRRTCAGYSCLTRVGPDHIGVLYEGPKQMYFQRFAIDELVE